MSTPNPDFRTYVTNLPDPEIRGIADYLVRHERDYLVALGELTKFRPVYLKTKCKPDQHAKWFRKYASERVEFGPIWLMAYGVGVLGPIEEAALAKLPIKLRDQLGYEPKVAGELPTAAQIVTFLKEAEDAFGVELARQWGNIFLLIMDPDAKQPVHDALNELDWNMCTAPVDEAAEGADAAPAPAVTEE